MTQALLLRRAALAALWTTLAVPALVLLWFLAGLVGALVPTVGAAPGEGVEIRLIGTGIHYDFLLPATPETRAAFAFAARAGVPVDADDTAWILAGWGARDFYTSTGRTRDMRPGPVWKAVTGDASVLRIDAYGAFAGEGALSLEMSPAQYTRLLAAIAATRSGPALRDAGFTATDAFFEAKGRFDAFETCNVWVGRMLRAAGLRFGAWTPTPQSLRLALAADP